MNPKPDLANLLRQLRLTGILHSLEARNRQAIQSKMAYTDFLGLLICDEVASRDQRRFDLRHRRASFPSGKTIEQFDFDFNPRINAALIHDLMTGRFLREKSPVLIAGPCGTGKSHIAQAIGHQAVRQEYDVRFFTAANLLGILYAARANGTHAKRFRQMTKIDLLIIDLCGAPTYVKFVTQTADARTVYVIRTQHNSLSSGNLMPPITTIRRQSCCINFFPEITLVTSNRAAARSLKRLVSG